MRNRWRKSSHSDDAGGHCVEVALRCDQVAVRDSKAPQAGHLVLSRGELAALLAGVSESRALNGRA
ncbi:DUF397 domain-containing protein [Actinomadura oligospora]|uniref:DUF397 domain-containing protein n=1 Tax=Actinomadura oligospora TaxID=111804 RepID=UPI0009FF8687|nr:DUF397 domain-containing protein [Actinomadura oligospora]